MKAIVYTTYGSPDVLQFKEVETPTPSADEVLIRVHATAVNAADWHLLRADPFVARLFSGLFKPKHTILGADIAGEIVSVGRNVTQFKPGDAVFGDLSGCGWGGFAEYVCAPAHVLLLKPANLTFEQAAAAPMAAVTAFRGLCTNGQVRPGQKVLINGASGGVGTFAVQIAKAFGADVTAVCSTRNLEQARALGADHVIDYSNTDFTASGQQYDLILAANGYHSLSAYKRALTPQGAYVMTGGTGAQMAQALLLGPLVSIMGKQKMGQLRARPQTNDLAAVAGLLAAGSVVPVIDRRYPLSETADAIRYLEAGHATGKVVITVV